MANYTQPHNPDHEDSPEHWLNSALIFARAIGLMLQPNQGVVVGLRGDMQCPDPDKVSNFVEHDKVIVYCSSNMVHIIKCDEDIEEGKIVWILNEDDEDLQGFNKAEE